MDSYTERNNRGHSHHYMNKQSYYLQEASPQEFPPSSNKKSSTYKSVLPDSSGWQTIKHKSFECRVCLNTYSSKRDLRSHLTTEQHLRPSSKHEANEVVNNRNRKRKSGEFVCKMCFDGFSTFRELDDHIKEVGHFWSAKRARSENSSCTIEASKKYQEPYRSSSTSICDPHLNDCENQNIIASEEMKGKSSSLSMHSSTGSSDAVFDDSFANTRKDIFILDDQREHSHVETEKTLAKEVSGRTKVSNNLLDITSPDSSSLLRLKTFGVSTMEDQSGMTLIPTEPDLQTADPRPTLQIGKEGMESQSQNQTIKSAPVYEDHLKPSIVENQIQWKLIPIDLSPTNYFGAQTNIKNASIPRVPSPTEDTLDASIDQLAAQLKENTGATFIPASRLQKVTYFSSPSLEGNLESHLIQGDISSHVPSSSSSENRTFLRSLTPVLDKTNHLETPDSVFKSQDDVAEQPIVLQTDVSLLAGCNLSSLPYAQSCESPVFNELATAVSSILTSNVMPSTTHPDEQAAQEKAPYSDAIDSLTGELSTTSVTPLTVPIDTPSSEVLTANTQKLSPNLHYSSIVEEKPRNIVEKVDSLSPESSKELDKVESRLFEMFGEDDKRSNLSANCSTAFPPSHRSYGKPDAVGEIIESCPKCQTVFDITRLKLDLKTGNIAISCHACDHPTVMKHAFKKKLRCT